MIKYLRNVYREAQNIQWPTKHLATMFTLGVIAIALFAVVYLGILDFAFVEVVNKFLI